MEKPMAATLADADTMIGAMGATGRQLAINWPLVWSRPHRTAKRLCDEGVIGEVVEVHYYGGNRGPLYHGADKVEVTEEEVARRKPESWFYRRSLGGGSLLDYLGYGTTLGTWSPRWARADRGRDDGRRAAGLRLMSIASRLPATRPDSQSLRRGGGLSPTRGPISRSRSVVS
jgi:hypothetical protein